jgi:hypothetical protein
VAFLRAILNLLFVATLAAIGVVWLNQHAPQHSPFAPLDLNGPIGLATGYKLARLAQDPAACVAAVQSSGLRATAVPDAEHGAFCGFKNVLAIEGGRTGFSPAPVRVTCPLAVSLYLWERGVVAPAAARHLGSAITRIDQAGSYACRRIYNRTAGRPSEHARANAIDVTGFRLADGRTVSLWRDWDNGTAAAAFLRDVRNGGCGLFRGVLGPDYNDAHRDHLHLDMGAYRVCR